MLYLVGLGLADEKDVTVKGLEAIKKADKVFLESYTSLLQVTTKDLERYYEKPLIVLGREGVEKDAEQIILAALEGNAAFLVVGDVFTATTHSDLYLRAVSRGVDVRVIPNAGIMNAVSLTGLDLYSFGKTTSIVYPEKNYSPESYYDAIKENHQRGLHTLCLLDIKAADKRYMTIPEAIKQLITIEDSREEELIKNNLLVGVARLACETQLIRAGSAEELLLINWGGPPQCLVVPGRLGVVEEEMLSRHR